MGADFREASVPLIFLRWWHLWHHHHLPGPDNYLHVDVDDKIILFHYHHLPGLDNYIDK